MGKIPITQLEKSRAGLRVQVLSPQNPVDHLQPPSLHHHPEVMSLQLHTERAVGTCCPPFCRTSSCHALWPPGDGDGTTSVLAQPSVLASSGDICQPRPLSPNFPGSWSPSECGIYVHRSLIPGPYSPGMTHVRLGVGVLRVIHPELCSQFTGWPWASVSPLVNREWPARPSTRHHPHHVHISLLAVESLQHRG